MKPRDTIQGITRVDLENRGPWRRRIWWWFGWSDHSEQARFGRFPKINRFEAPVIAHHGHTEIRAAVEGYARRMESAGLRLLNIAVNGNVVLTERIDEMVYDGNKISARCMGAFEVRDDKITAWRDYFDVP
ncbi:limonene-1,2-epoxide hydrolase family protein [Mycobacterium asiaticum]|uniref:limonene-1,2-epoxide hydrolase family protein n=1 Tax=Mycobacterium asiaticum TaxID=1790 RepID=UPI0007F04636|nr:limonene-1,2-epoxide hydrolase family protein [Mycobacterium asiaticum]OBI87184.1 hypothetical protein A5661_08900 [Mycobacterium asiaticum]